MSDKTNAINISVVLVQEENGGWSAQCLEYDLAAQAPSLPDLRYELQRVLLGHIYASVDLGREPFQNIGPAPRRFWELYDGAKLRIESDDIPFRHPNPGLYPPINPRLKIAEHPAS